MALHALLFIIAPSVISGVFPGVQPGEQGGLTYVTLIDAPQSPQPRAAVAEAARRPQARPTPQSRPTPSNTSVGESRPTESPSQPSQPVAVAVAAPVPEEPRPVARPVQPRPEPVLTSPRGNVEMPEATGGMEESEISPPLTEGGGSLSDGVDHRDEEAAAPEAVIDPEPQLPPTGESMLRSFGGSTFPKNAVGLVHGSVNVEVAAIVSSEGTLVDAIVVQGSGISVVDSHAQNVVRHLIQFRPYDAMYEMRVFITFDSADQDRLHFRYSEFITSPPTVGQFAN